MTKLVLRWMQLQPEVFRRHLGDIYYTPTGDNVEDWISIGTTTGKHFPDMPDFILSQDMNIEYAVRHAISRAGFSWEAYYYPENTYPMPKCSVKVETLLEVYCETTTLAFLRAWTNYIESKAKGMI